MHHSIPQFDMRLSLQVNFQVKITAFPATDYSTTHTQTVSENNPLRHAKEVDPVLQLENCTMKGITFQKVVDAEESVALSISISRH